jgi:hypothetical protein
VKFKLDENLGQTVAIMLRAAHHEVATVAEQGREPRGILLAL